MTNVPYNPARACDDCGRFGAHALGEAWLCLECYEGRGSCCAERTMFVEEERCGPGQAARGEGNPGQTLNPNFAGGMAALPPAGETHRVSANCCYEACPGCSYLKKLREFQSRHSRDWPTRLRGLPRIVAKAQARA